MIFDVETRTFSGRRSNEDLGNLNIMVIVTDKEGETVSDTFELKVLNVDDASTLDHAIANQVATEDEEFNFTLAEDTFNDMDSGDSLTYSATNADGVDTITDFSVKEDTLVFSAAGFGGNLVAGKISSQMFTLGTAATSSSHRFIYHVGSGDLFYDSDGIGGNEQVRIAQLDSGLSLSSDNLLVG